MAGSCQTTDGATGTAARFDNPRVLGAFGTSVYVAEYSTVRSVDTTTGATSVVGRASWRFFGGTAAGRSAYLISQSEGLVRIDLATGVKTVVNATGPQGVFTADASSVWGINGNTSTGTTSAVRKSKLRLTCR